MQKITFRNPENKIQEYATVEFIGRPAHGRLFGNTGLREFWGKRAADIIPAMKAAITAVEARQVYLVAPEDQLVFHRLRHFAETYPDAEIFCS